jgi:hypothetical protein
LAPTEGPGDGIEDHGLTNRGWVRAGRDLAPPPRRATVGAGAFYDFAPARWRAGTAGRAAISAGMGSAVGAGGRPARDGMPATGSAAICVERGA